MDAVLVVLLVLRQIREAFDGRDPPKQRLATVLLVANIMEQLVDKIRSNEDVDCSWLVVHAAARRSFPLVLT